MDSTTIPTASANGNGDCAGHLDPDSLPGLLEKLVERDREFIRRDFGKGQYQIRLKEYWMVIRTENVDDFDFMRLDRALRERITERGWHYGLGLMSSAVLHGRLARICIPASSSGSPCLIPRPLWIWESHQEEDAIALLRAYCMAVEKVEELLNATNHAA
jgi:hypothetical protein